MASKKRKSTAGGGKSAVRLADKSRRTAPPIAVHIRGTLAANRQLVRGCLGKAHLRRGEAPVGAGMNGPAGPERRTGGGRPPSPGLTAESPRLRGDRLAPAEAGAAEQKSKLRISAASASSAVKVGHEELSEQEAFLADASANGLWACPEFAEREDSTGAAGPPRDTRTDTGRGTDECEREALSDSTCWGPSESVFPANAGKVGGAGSFQIRRFSTLQRILAVCIVCVVAMVVYAVLKSSSDRIIDLAPSPQPTPAAQVLPDVPARKKTVETEKPGLSRAESRELAASPKEAISLTVAETFYLQKDYDRAYAAYNQLRQARPADGQDDPLNDFLQLKMAFCLKKGGKAEQANRLFKTLLQSPLPAVRALAAYQQSFAELDNSQYWQARSRAYQTIALVETFDFYRDWALSLERDCHFLVAESLTRNVLSLCDADKDLPPQLWSHPLEADPFINVTEAELRSFLNSGWDQLRKALLGPQIQKLEARLPDGQGHSTGVRWSIICCGAPIEELLARFAAHAGLDIQWTYESAFDGPGLEQTDPQIYLGANRLTPPSPWRGSAGRAGIKDAIRKRPVNLYLSAATAQHFIAVAAGSVGLLAQLDAQGTVKILNPSDFSSLSEHLAMLCQEAELLWQRFLLTSVGDDRIGSAHFALGLLAVSRGEPADAIAQYKLVANRFSQTSFAPYALLHSSRLKVNLRDFTGAREDLKELIALYGDTEISDRACLELADATMQAGLFDEGARLYRKAYNLGLSSQSQIASALGAGRCLYQMKDYQAAAEWLNRFISLTKDYTSTDFNMACLLLGKIYLAQGLPQQATDALEYALYPHGAGTLPGRLGRQDYVEVVSALVDAHTQQGHFIEALNILERARPWQFSQKDSIEMLLLKSKVFRFMGLFDKAILLLRDSAEYLLDTQLKAKVLYELAKCQIAEQDLELARSNLTEVLVLTEPGPFAHEVACELAAVCLKLQQNSQAASICIQLLDSAPAAPVRQRALDILATAKFRQKNYEGAVLALLGWPNAKQVEP